MTDQSTLQKGTITHLRYELGLHRKVITTLTPIIRKIKSHLCNLEARLKVAHTENRRLQLELFSLESPEKIIKLTMSGTVRKKPVPTESPEINQVAVLAHIQELDDAGKVNFINELVKGVKR